MTMSEPDELRVGCSETDSTNTRSNEAKQNETGSNAEVSQSDPAKEDAAESASVCETNDEAVEAAPESDKPAEIMEMTVVEEKEEDNKVMFTITIAQAYKSIEQVPKEEDVPVTTDKAPPESKKKKRNVTEVPKAQNYFHFEYLLMPEGEDRVRSDVVTYGVAAKIYTEKLEPKVLMTWCEGKLTWVSWTHCHTLTITDELLMRMFNHRVELRVWDTRDRVSTRARFDRPRAFKLPQPKPGESEDIVGGVKGLVMSQSLSFQGLQPKCSSMDRPLPSCDHSAKQQHESIELHQQQQQKMQNKEQARKNMVGRISMPSKVSEFMDTAGHRVPANNAASTKLPHIDAGGTKSSGLVPAKGSIPTGTANDTVVQAALAEAEKLDHLSTYTRLSKLAGRSMDTQDARLQSRMSAAVHSPKSGERALRSSGGGRASGGGGRASGGERASGGGRTSGGERASGGGRASGGERASGASGGGQGSGASGGGASVVSADRASSTFSQNGVRLPEQQPPAYSTTCTDLVEGHVANLEDDPHGENSSNTQIGAAGGGRAGAGLDSTSPKRQATASSLADEIRKNGLVCVSIPLAKLFSGIPTVTERLREPAGSIMDLFFGITITGSLMTEQQHRKLNPIVIKVHSATKMPNTPYSYQELRDRCEPAYVKYKFMNMPESRSMGRPQHQGIYWDDVNVFLTGMLEPSELHEFLHGPLFNIEVHDRDRKHTAQKKKLDATLFGDDLEDEKISNVGTVASRRTLHNPFNENYKTWDPYGVAKFDLSALLLGQTVIHIKSQIHPSPIPELLGCTANSSTRLGVPGSIDGPVDASLRVGHYLDTEAMLKIKVEIAYPLVTPKQVADKESLTTEQCPFGRIVFRFAYTNTRFLYLVQAMVIEINAAALGLHSMPTHIIETALSTYKLSIEQQQSRDLDIVTGFHVLDGEMHLFVLEGLKDQAIKHIWNNLPKSFDTDIEVMYHSGLGFAHRLYGPMDVDVCRIKLHEALSTIVQQPLLYIRDMVPKPCFQALTKLIILAKQSKLRDAVRADLFPTAEMIISMSREFGVPLTAEDFEELQCPNKAAAQEGRLGGASGADGDMETAVPLHPHLSMLTSVLPSRTWTPIDNHNEEFLLHMERRERDLRKDFHQRNMDYLHEKSVQNSMAKLTSNKHSVHVPGNPVHNYSQQTLNSTQQATEAIRHILHEKDPDRLYTYCPDFHNAMTLVPVNVDAVRKAEEQASKAAFRTPNGFTYPGKKTMIQSNAHPNKPGAARIQELRGDWAKNDLHAEELQPTTNEHGRYSFLARAEDMDLYPRPPGEFGMLGVKTPAMSIHLAGDTLEGERRAAADRAHDTWTRKLVVDDPRTRMHRLNPATELKERGMVATNQLDQLKGLRKDPPPARAAVPPFLESPPFNVVMHPFVDTAARERGHVEEVSTDRSWKKGFTPGPYESYSWNFRRNHIPAPVYEHDKPRQGHSRDFNAFHKERSCQSKRPIPPLTANCNDTNMFCWPNDDRFTMQFPRSYTFADVDQFKVSQRQQQQQHQKQVSPDSGLGASLNSRQNTTAAGGVTGRGGGGGGVSPGAAVVGGGQAKEVSFLKEDTMFRDQGMNSNNLRKEATMAL